MDVVLLLQSDKGKYSAAGGVGIFGVKDSVIVPLIDRGDEHLRFAGMKVEAFIADVVTLRKALQPRSPR